MGSDNGGPAFPVVADFGGEDRQCDEGMSLRDYFAAAALTALPLDDCPYNRQAMHAANAAYVYADAMLRARNREGEQHGE